ncbi:MAG: ABC transporter substrate-binding protein [Actinomycetota bacterium]|nr:ABC transporter substrate-binding protein [Actinomycetota bacterium]
MKPTFRRWRSWVGPSAATAITVSLVAAMSVADATGASAATRKHATASKGAVVTMAEGAQGTPNNIMPFVSGANNSQANTNLQEQMWPTLYTIGTASNVNAINAPLSLADPPVYSNGDTQVSVTLKPYKWSDGTALTARDVTFFMNILKANKTSWAHYTPGDMPTNVVSWTAKGANTVVFKLNRAYNPTWFTDDELAYIVPLPQHAWDKESATGAVGTYDLTTAGAKAVYSFLNTQGENTATYGSNPLWQVVDGAWKIKQYTSNGFVALVPNTAYSGPDKPKIAKFEEEPFTSSTAEFNALLGGNLDIGYVPLNDLAEKSRVQGAGYRPVRSELVAVNMLSLNYYSPVVGPLVKQVYIRQALNDVMDQPAQISAILHGTGGYVDFGPIPTVPKTPYMAALQKKSPFDVSAARKLLTSHGWKIPSNGAAECVRPGTGSSECGAGIAKGKTLTFSLVYVSGSGYLTATMENYKSDASEVGIVLNLSQQPFNSIVGDICGTPTCDSPGWQIANWGAGFSWNFGSPYPVGATMFEGHVGLDYPVPKKLASLITATETAPVSKTAEAMKAYDSWVIKNDPEVWQIETYTLNAVSNKLKGVTFYPVTGNVFPQDFVVK